MDKPLSPLAIVGLHLATLAGSSAAKARIDAEKRMLQELIATHREAKAKVEAAMARLYALNGSKPYVVARHPYDVDLVVGLRLAKRRPTCPTFAKPLLALVASPDRVEMVLGCMEEQFFNDAAGSVRRARRRFFGAAIDAFVRLAAERASDWLHRPISRR